MEKYTLEITTEEENMDAAMNFIEECIQAVDNIKAAQHIMLVSEELIFNVFSYAYNGNAGILTITVCVCVQDRTVSIELRDAGMEYNPLEKEEPDLTLHISERKIGGLGILLSTKLTDEQYYTRKDGQNILKVIKKW